jgi:hypothetical protein
MSAAAGAPAGMGMPPMPFGAPTMIGIEAQSVDVTVYLDATY